MKKITFILFALISGTVFAQSSDTGTATVNAKIVSPISIASTGVLDFGKIASTPSGGEITISPAGTLDYVGAGMEIAGNTGSVPTFSVTAQNGYSISLPSTLEISSGTNKLTLKDFKTSLASDSGVTTSDFTLGATLVVGVKQAAGDYTGEVEITVSYE